MVDITISNSRQIRIAGEYFTRLIKWIDDNEKWDHLGDARANEMMNYFHQHVREYVLAAAVKLKTKSDDFSNIYATEKRIYGTASRKAKKTTSYGRFVKRMRDIYNGFMQSEDDNGVKNGYWLMKKMGVKVCPYCNRNYTMTVYGRDVQVRPEFDHFHPEALYPSLILSFYNFVPSCPECNHLKRTQEIDVNPWLGYGAALRPKFKVDTSKGDFPANPMLILDNENENTRKLGIKELYNEHTDYVKDILNKIQAYNPATYSAIKKDFQGIVHTEAGLERMIWGNYIRMEDAGKRSFAKLTADVLDQYKKYL